MKLDQYIKELLIEKDSIIIKDFGAFEKVLQSAEIDEDTGEIKPPHVTLKFDPSLKIDSGTLSKFVAEKEKISEEEAVKQIAEQVKVWEKELKEGKSVLLEGIGLIKVKEGKKVFDAQIEPGTFPDMYGLPVITVEKAEPVNPRKQPIRKEPPKKKTQEKTSEKTAKKILEERRKAAQRRRRPVRKTVKQKTDKGGSEKNNTKLVVTLVILVILIAIGVLVALNFEMAKEKFGLGVEYVNGLFSSGAEENADENLADEFVDNDSNQIAEIDNIDSATINQNEDETQKILENYTVIDGQTNQTVSSDEQVQGNYKIEIIAGSFKKLQNAKRYRNQLNNKGFSAKVLPKSNGLYRVSVGSFNDLKAAGSEIENLHEIDPTLNVWILLNK